MSDPVPLNRSRSNPVRRLVLLAALMVVMFVCMRTLRFTHDGFNIAFGCLFLVIPFFAIKPALHLSRWAKTAALILLIPLSALSALFLLITMVGDVPAAIDHVELSRELCTLYQGKYSVRLAWEETAGGAVGPHGVILEQRRTIFPGLFAVRYVDYFEGASEGTISFTGPNTVSLYIPIAGYDEDEKDVRRVYSLKPWLYF
jgi:hypothetical protein